jgi:hypothetical protein
VNDRSSPVPTENHIRRIDYADRRDWACGGLADPFLSQLDHQIANADQDLPTGTHKSRLTDARHRCPQGRPHRRRGDRSHTRWQASRSEMFRPLDGLASVPHDRGDGEPERPGDPKAAADQSGDEQKASVVRVRSLPASAIASPSLLAVVGSLRPESA